MHYLVLTAFQLNTVQCESINGTIPSLGVVVVALPLRHIEGKMQIVDEQASQGAEAS